MTRIYGYRLIRGALALGVLAFCCLFSHAGHADTQVEMLRTLCLADANFGHFSVRREVFEDFADYIYDPKKLALTPQKSHAQLLKQRFGVLVPDKFSYACSPSLDSNYKIFGYRPTSPQCGNGAQIVLSLEKNGKLILDEVPFSPWCTDDGSGYVSDITVDGRYIRASISNGHTQYELPLSYIKEPLTANTVDCLVRQGYLRGELKDTEHALKTCFPSYKK